MSQHLVTLLLGSNLGNSEKNIEIALSSIETEIGDIINKTEILYTEPVGFVSKNIFCNIALLIKTQFSPMKLLESVKRIEREMGRTEDTLISKVYKDRVIDIDIILFENIQFYSKKLRIPHQKNLYERDFSRKLLNVLEK